MYSVSIFGRKNKKNKKGKKQMKNEKVKVLNENIYYFIKEEIIKVNKHTLEREIITFENLPQELK
jgi:translation initiation factor IF-2